MSAGRRLAVVAMAVLAAACAGDDGAGLAGEPPPPEAGTSATTAGGSPAVDTTDGGAGPPPSPPPGGPSPPGGAGPAPTQAVPPSGFDAGGPPGSFAPALLRPDASSRLVIEVLSQSGAGPGAATVDHVAAVLGEVAGKPVEVVAAGVPGEGRSWTGDEIRAAADAAGATPQGGGTAVVRLLFLNGGFAGNDTALGVSVRGDVAAVFADRVTQASSPLVGRRAIEVAVTTHEVGHLLGLVDLYLDTGRADPDHPGHSPNRRSVMYWAVESSLVADVLQGGPPRDFDAADRADLARIRAGA